MSKALGMAILQVAGRDMADPGHSGAGDIGIEVLIEHPDNLAAPPHGRDQIHPRRPGRGHLVGHKMSRKAVGGPLRKPRHCSLVWSA